MLLAVLLLPVVAAGAISRPVEAPDPVPSSLDLATDPASELLLLNHFDNTDYDTLADSQNDTDFEHVIRKKRTFGDVVFRGLADVLGYSVAKKPAPPTFPPPLDPVAGIDFPLQAGPAPAAPCGSALANPPPCGRAAAPPTPPPCPKPRAVPPPAPPPAPPCGSPRANPAIPPPCVPPKLTADTPTETISSNLRLSFNFNRATPAPQAATAAAADNANQPEPIPIEPKAAQLPVSEPDRKPRVYVDAFVVRNGVAQKVDTVDADKFNARQVPADDDYVAYDDDGGQKNVAYDDYEDAQESRDRAKAVREFGTAVDRFWKHKKPKGKKVGNQHRNINYNSGNQFDRQGSTTHQSLQREQPNYKRVSKTPGDEFEPDDGSEVTTTTEDPENSLRPRILPRTEQNPGKIDTVTVRVPPIYKERRPRKHRKRPEHSERSKYDEEEELSNKPDSRESYYDYNSEQNLANQETPPPQRRRKKLRRRTRSIKQSENESNESEEQENENQNSDDRENDEQDSEGQNFSEQDFEAPYLAGDYDYFGNRTPISDEEKAFDRLFALNVPDPTPDPDVERVEGRAANSAVKEINNKQLNEAPGYFLDDDERISNEDKSANEPDKSSENEKVDDREKENYTENERSGELERSNSAERSDILSPNAQVHLHGYKKNLVKATNIQVDEPRSNGGSLVKKSVRIGSP